MRANSLSITELEVRNFRSLHSLDMKFPAEGIVLVGKNNHGKTNVFKALTTILSFGRETLDNNDFPITKWRGNTSIKLTLEVSDKDVLDTFGRTFRRRPNVVTIACRTSKKEKGVLQWEMTAKDQKKDRKAGKQARDEMLTVLRKKLEFLFVPSQRDPTRDAELGHDSNLRRLLDLLFKDTSQHRGRRTAFEKQYDVLSKEGQRILAKAKRRLLVIGREYLGLQTLSIEPRLRRPADVYEGFDFKVSDGITEALLQEKGTGWQSAFVVMLLQYVAELQLSDQTVIFGIEEPDAYLHSGAERKMWEAIRSLAAKHQVMVSTHSPVMIDAMDKHEWGRLYKLEKTKRTTLVLPKRPLTPKEASTYEMQCDTELSEILYADGVLFVEGPSDKAVWELLLSTQNVSDCNIKVVEVGGCGRATLFVDFAERFCCPWVLLFDFDVVLKGKSGGDDFARVARGKSPMTGRGYVSDTGVESVKRYARGPMVTYADRKRTTRKINCLLEKNGILVLPVDLEYEVITPANESQIVNALKNPDVASRGLPGCYKSKPFSGTQTERVDKLRKAIGSKGLSGKRDANAKLKLRHIPRTIVAALPERNRPRLLVSYAKRIATMLKARIARAANLG